MSPSSSDLEERLARKGVSRRQFIKFCTAIGATLGLSGKAAFDIAGALAAAPRLPLIWLEFQDCTGDTESFLRSSNSTVSQILLELISLDYHETLMVPAGRLAEKSRVDTMTKFAGQYVAVVEGSIPMANGGTYCMIGGRTALDIARDVCGKAMATITVGTCAWEGGWPSAAPNPTGAVGVKDAVPGLSRLINLPGCPMNVVNFTALIVHYLNNQSWPELDAYGRPTFAYGQKIHDACERKGRPEAKAFGDANHVNGGCLKGVGCRGPQTPANCHKVKWNDGTNWCIGAGAPCNGCTTLDFWDTMHPLYRGG